MLIEELIKIYEYDIYNNNDIKQENIKKLAEIIDQNREINLTQLFDLRKCSNKFCWKNFIAILEANSYESKVRGIDILFILLQDANWPVYDAAMNLLNNFELKILKPYIIKYLKRAREEDDEMWIENIMLLAKKMQIKIS